MMRRPINPLVDCVFKALFGVEENLDLLTHFINAILAPACPVRRVTLIPQLIPAERDEDDTTVVDVCAEDEQGRIFQVEVQLHRHAHLVPRILYCWADIYQGQLQQGQDWNVLRPVVSIWILERNLLPRRPGWHHRYQVRDEVGGLLSEHLEIHTVELAKFAVGEQDGLDEAERWVYFLKEARRWRALPARLETPELRKAMSVIARWSEKNVDYRAYQARLNGLRIKRDMEQERARLLAEKQQLTTEKQQLTTEKQQLTTEKQQLTTERHRLAEEMDRLARGQAEAQREAASLRARLLAAGIDPDGR